MARQNIAKQDIQTEIEKKRRWSPVRCLSIATETGHVEKYVMPWPCGRTWTNRNGLIYDVRAC